MKSSIIVCALVVLACLCLQAEADCEIDGEKVPTGVHYRNCMKMTCNDDGTISGLGCAEWRCQPGKQTGYKEMDLSKNYPQCCPGPICAP